MQVGLSLAQHSDVGYGGQACHRPAELAVGVVEARHHEYLAGRSQLAAQLARLRRGQHRRPLHRADHPRLLRRGLGKGSERDIELNVDVHGTLAARRRLEQGVRDEAVHHPHLCCVTRLDGYVVRLLHDIVEGAVLPYGLAVVLVDPLLGTVGGDDNQRHLAVKGLGHRRRVVEHRRPRRAHKCHGPLRLHGHTQGDEGRAAFVDDDAPPQLPAARHGKD